MKRYGEGITRVLNSFGPVPDFSGEGAKNIFNVSVIAANDTEPHIHLCYLAMYCINVICI